MSDAIFTSTGQAIHTSFLIMSLEVQAKTAFRQVLMRIIEAVELPSARLKAWYKELQGSPGTVNFDGLDPYEVRAQCAMVTSAVKNHLPDPERDVIWAKHGYQVERGNGVQGWADYVAPQLTIEDTDVIKGLIYGHFHPELRKSGLSYDDISKLKSIHVKTLKRATSIIAKASDKMEQRAFDRLTPMFERDGLVELGWGSPLAA